MQRMSVQEVKETFEAELMRYIVNSGGSISAEHGIGSAKKKYLGIQKSEGVLKTMRLLKTLYDPNGILNPGKVL